jgi:hypothetical protein
MIYPANISNAGVVCERRIYANKDVIADLTPAGNNDVRRQKAMAANR